VQLLIDELLLMLDTELLDSDEDEDDRLETLLRLDIDDALEELPGQRTAGCCRPFQLQLPCFQTHPDEYSGHPSPDGSTE